MTGYSFQHGMSNNALDAYYRNVKPLSQITADDFVNAGWKHTKKLAVWLAKNNHWDRAEWHHTGGTWYNKINFYDPKELVDMWNDLKESERQHHVDECNKKVADTKHIKVKGIFTLWDGSRRHPQRIGEKKFIGILRGNWIYMNDGSRKKALGNHINWIEV